MNNDLKKSIAMRFNPGLIDEIDDYIQQSSFCSRTDFFETAASSYLVYMKEIEMDVRNV